MNQKRLTEQQRIFAYHPDAVFVMACPGAGKTETILRRVSSLKDLHESRRGIAVISFTNSAVDEFKERSSNCGVLPHLDYPGFIGTLDSFIRQFIFTQTGTATVDSPHVVDSWDSLGTNIRLRGDAVYRGNDKVSLDHFDTPNCTLNSGGLKYPIRDHVLKHKDAYEVAARKYRVALNAKGYYSISQCKEIALQKIGEVEFSTALGKLLVERFFEIIVDEAQDCNLEDLKVLEWLRSIGVRVTMVCDINQSIYEFRDGDKQAVMDFSNSYPENDRLVIDGSFRCSRSVCSLTSSLRTEKNQDDSLGDAGRNEIPIALIPYTAPINGDIGLRFKNHVLTKGLNVDDIILLSHAGKNSLQAVGGLPRQENGSSRVGQVAFLVNEFWTSENSSARNRTIEKLEKILLVYTGKSGVDSSVKKIITENGINARNLRRQALELLMKLPRGISTHEADKLTWIAKLRELIISLDLPTPPRTTVSNFFKKPPASSQWNICLPRENITTQLLKHSTIHKAKGREFDCVCIVLPPDSGRGKYTSDLVTTWTKNIENEPKRVLYVGVTRSKKLTAIAIPKENIESIIAILDRDSVIYEIV